MWVDCDSDHLLYKECFQDSMLPWCSRDIQGKKKGGDDDDAAFGLVILISPDTLCQAATPSSTQPVSEVALLQPSFDINQPTAHQAGGSFEAIPTKVSRNLLECSFYWISTWFSAFFFNSRGVKNAWRWRWSKGLVSSMSGFHNGCLRVYLSTNRDPHWLHRSAF